ncbi:MAG: hypothetical protein WCV82_02775 [Candidatus Paceibacterota bacterium]
MGTILKDLVMVVVLVAVVGGAVKGSMYAKKAWDDGHDSDALLRSRQGLIDQRQKSAAEIAADLQAARAALAAEAAKLSYMRAGFSLSAYRGFIIEQQAGVENALWSSDPLFNDPRSTDPTFKAQVDSAAARRIEALRQEINKLFLSWKADNSPIKPADVNLINNYLEELKAIVSIITPANSGLTQAEIDKYKEAVSDAEKVVDEVTNDPNPGGVVTPEDIEKQKDAVDKAQGEVDELEGIIDNFPSDPSGGDTGGTGGGSTGGSTGGSSSSDDEPPPSSASGPVIPTDTGKPTLIQGTNSF